MKNLQKHKQLSKISIIQIQSKPSNSRRTSDADTSISPTEEPLKTLIDLKMDTDVPDFMTASRDEHLAVERSTDASDFVAAVEALVKMPIVGVRNDNRRLDNRLCIPNLLPSGGQRDFVAVTCLLMTMTVNSSWSVALTWSTCATGRSPNPL